MFRSFMLSFFLTIVSESFSCCARDDYHAEIIKGEGNGEDEEITEPKLSNRIMIVPDIQNYMDDSSRYKYIDSITNYYLSNISDFAACIQVGDLTNNNRTEQYQTAYDHFFSRFPKGKEPYFCLGNHDYGVNGTSNTRSSNLPNFMKPVMDFSMDANGYENYVRFLQIGDTQYAVLDLEFAPRNEAIAWANDVVQSYSTIPFIILTHVFTNKYGQIHDVTDSSVYYPGSQKSYIMDGDYINDSMEIFNKLIYNNPNIIMVICGHTFIPDYIEVCSKKNSIGKDVYVVTVNYQHYIEGGSGYVGILEFGEKFYNIRSFSTVASQYGPINITFGGETSVKDVKKTNKEKTAIYNLDGQRIHKLQKGIFIVNGMKTIVK